MRKVALVAGMFFFTLFLASVSLYAAEDTSEYQYQETKDLVKLVRDAAVLIEKSGDAALPELRKERSQWRHGKLYIFVVDTDGNMVVHPDPALEGKNQIGLKDPDGKLIIKGLIDETKDSPAKEEWFHYQWPEPGSIFSAWKTTFAKRVTASSGKTYVVACGLYNMPMEKAFIVETVDTAAALIEKEGKNAFSVLHDKTTQFLFLNTYIFVDTPEGVEVVNPGFPSIEGKNILDYRDQAGKYLTRELVNIALTKGSGWVDYLWPKPGETKPSKKETYVKKAVYGNEVYIVGCGAYFESEEATEAGKMDKMARRLMVIELKDGRKIQSEVVRETSDSVFLANPDGSMEVSFPRARISKIRNLTQEELGDAREKLLNEEKQKAATPAQGQKRDDS